MDADTINLVVVVVMGIVAVAALIVLAYGQQAHNTALVNALTPYQSIAETLAFRFDEVLSLHGELLKPIYDVTTAAETLIDEEDDWMRQLLPEQWTTLAQSILDWAEKLSDGKPPVADGEGQGEKTL